jgi:membrane associated rhomboid family serine protease
MLDQINLNLYQIIYLTQQNEVTLLKFSFILFAVYFVNLLLGQRLLLLGIVPRTPFGLIGIFCSPFLHANFNHLFFNLIPFIILSDFILIQGVDYYLHVSFYIALISGGLTWCFAKEGIHVGASGVITGYWGLLVTQAYFYGGFIAYLLAAVCVYYFAGIFLGIFPREKGVSWEGHLFGLIAGGIVAYFKI